MKRWFLLGCLLAAFIVVLTGCGTIASARGVSASNVPVQVTLRDLKIDSSLSRFLVNVSYHFTITNKSSKAHEFMLGPLIQPGMTMSDVEQQQLFGFKTIAPGATKFADVVFKSPASWGVWQFSCHIGTLYEPRMRLNVIVVDPSNPNV